MTDGPVIVIWVSRWNGYWCQSQSNLSIKDQRSINRLSTDAENVSLSSNPAAIYIFCVSAHVFNLHEVHKSSGDVGGYNRIGVASFDFMYRVWQCCQVVILFCFVIFIFIFLLWVFFFLLLIFFISICFSPCISSFPYCDDVDCFLFVSLILLLCPRLELNCLKQFRSIGTTKK